LKLFFQCLTFAVWRLAFFAVLFFACLTYFCIENNTSFTVSGSGAPLRQFIFSEDLARLFLWVLRSYDSPESIILSVDEKDEISIADVVKHITTAMDFKGEIIFDKSKADGQFKKTASNKKLRGLIGNDFSFTPIDQGIKQTVQWFSDNFDKARK
jgi:GDP-L-fucose synthase